MLASFSQGTYEEEVMTAREGVVNCLWKLWLSANKETRREAVQQVLDQFPDLYLCDLLDDDGPPITIFAYALGTPPGQQECQDIIDGLVEATGFDWDISLFTRTEERIARAATDDRPVQEPSRDRGQREWQPDRCSIKC